MKYHAPYPVVVANLVGMYNISTVLIIELKLTNVTRHTPVVASHSLIVLSRDPETTNGPAVAAAAAGLLPVLYME